MISRTKSNSTKEKEYYNYCAIITLEKISEKEITEISDEKISEIGDGKISDTSDQKGIELTQIRSSENPIRDKKLRD